MLAKERVIMRSMVVGIVFCVAVSAAPLRARMPASKRPFAASSPNRRRLERRNGTTTRERAGDSRSQTVSDGEYGKACYPAHAKSFDVLRGQRAPPIVDRFVG